MMVIANAILFGLKGRNIPAQGNAWVRFGNFERALKGQNITRSKHPWVLSFQGVSTYTSYYLGRCPGLECMGLSGRKFTEQRHYFRIAPVTSIASRRPALGRTRLFQWLFLSQDPLIPMQPSPSAETSMPRFPSLRFCFHFHPSVFENDS